MLECHANPFGQGHLRHAKKACGGFLPVPTATSISDIFVRNIPVDALYCDF
jgi:hypothetical protein